VVSTRLLGLLPLERSENKLIGMATGERKTGGLRPVSASATLDERGRGSAPTLHREKRGKWGTGSYLVRF